MRLRCVTIIIVQNTAEKVVSLNGTGLWNRFYWGGTLLSQPRMRSSHVVVRGVVPQRMTEVPLIHDQQAIQTFFSNGTNPALSNSIRGAIRCVDHFDSRCQKNGIECSREFGVPIMNQETKGRGLRVQRPA